MIFKTNKHDDNLYNTLLVLSRNIFFYKELSLPDTFETRIYLMFIHFSIILKIFKKKKEKFNQNSYDMLFNNIESNLRESGFGDVTVNKKMKDMNKLLYDILLKFEKNDTEFFMLNSKLVSKYFSDLKDEKEDKYMKFESYFSDFYNFCFELPLDNMLSKAINFKK